MASELRTQETAREPVLLPPARLTAREALREAWTQRALAVPMGARLIGKTYAKTKLGAGWLVLRPILDTVGKSLLFGTVLGVAAAPDDVPYYLFLLVGMAAWRLFDQTLIWSTRGFDRFAKLVRTFSFPLLLVPIAASAFGWLEFLIYVIIIVVVFAVFLVTDGTLYLNVGPELLYGCLGLVLALGLGLGLSLWLSVLNARWRDVRLALRYVMEIWLYVTPVIFPLTQLPESVRTIAQINPMAPIVELVKEGFLDAGTISAPAVAWAVVATVGTLTSGLWFFARHSARFVVPQTDAEELDEDDEFLS